MSLKFSSDCETGAEPDLSTVNSSTSAASKPRGKPFEPGNRHGRGRPPGSRNKSTQLFYDLLDEFTPLLAKKTLRMALDGDHTALKLAVERVAPPAQGNRVTLRIPKVRSAADLAKVSAAVIQAAAKGNITTDEGKAMAEMLQAHRRILEGEAIEHRIAALERRGYGSLEAFPLKEVATNGSADTRETGLGNIEAIDAK